MTVEFESAFREMLRVIVKEVVEEVVLTRSSETLPDNFSSESGYLITSREAAERLSISQKHLHKLNRSGVLPCVRIGQLVRYSVTTIQNWIRDSETTEQPTPRPRSTNQPTNPVLDEPTKPASKLPVKSRTKEQSRPAEAAKTKQRTSQPVRRKVAQTSENNTPKICFVDCWLRLESTEAFSRRLLTES